MPSFYPNADEKLKNIPEGESTDKKISAIMNAIQQMGEQIRYQFRHVELKELSMKKLVGILGVEKGGTGAAKAGANKVFAGPASGNDAEPGWRSLTAADIPSLAMSKISGLADALSGKVSKSGDTMTGTLNVNGYVKPQAIELIPTTSATHGGFIDFHYAGSADDYTTRIIEESSRLHIVGKQLFVDNRIESTSYARLRGGYFITDKIITSGGSEDLISIWTKDLADQIGIWRTHFTGNSFKNEWGSRRPINGTTYFNTIALGISDAGTRTVQVSDAGAWRSAIGAASQTDIQAKMSLTQHTISNISVPANGTANATVNITKSGYYPYGIGGWHLSGTGSSYAWPVWLYLSARGNGTATINYCLRSVAGNAHSFTFYVDVIWVKMT